MMVTLRSAARARAGRNRGLAAVLFGALLAGACTAEERSDRAHFARDALVGLSATELDSCAGTPNAIRSSGDMEFWTYSTDSIDRAYRAPSEGRLDDDGIFGRGTRAGLNSGNSLPSSISSSYCETTFSLVNGRVAQVEYRSPTGIRIGDFGTRYADCERTVAGCLARVERRLQPDVPIDEVIIEDLPPTP